ncbi:MAG: 30S ribosome-binding factor RbfA [Deltaproteobacteria bacterium]|nr:30S ribosome-binding factor RbfA [Deltaproteobacteria bacterium]
MTTRRQDRVAHLIHEEVASMLSRGEAKDPALVAATVTGARVSPDLRLATVYFSALGDDATLKRVADGLKRATPFFRREVARRLQLKFAPEVVFRRDESLAFGQEVEGILERIHAEDRPVDPPDASGADEPNDS